MNDGQHLYLMLHNFKLILVDHVEDVPTVGTASFNKNRLIFVSFGFLPGTSEANPAAVSAARGLLVAVDHTLI